MIRNDCVLSSCFDVVVLCCAVSDESRMKLAREFGESIGEAVEVCWHLQTWSVPCPLEYCWPETQEHKGRAEDNKEI